MTWILRLLHVCSPHMRHRSSGMDIYSEWKVRNLYIDFPWNRIAMNARALSCECLGLSVYWQNLNVHPQLSSLFPYVCSPAVFFHTVLPCMAGMPCSGKGNVMSPYGLFHMPEEPLRHGGKAFIVRCLKAFFMTVCVLCWYWTDCENVS